MAYKNAEYGKLRRKELYRDHGKGSKKKSYERDREKTLKRKREYYKENCERIKQYQRDFRQREDFSQKHSIHVRNWKDRVFDKILLHYGSKCVCCGEGNKKFLTVDHVDGGGNKHRKSIGYLRSWIVKNDFPEGYQILCMNCNWGRTYNNGVCPHKE